MAQFLDGTGLGRVWTRMKTYIATAIGGKADKVSSPTTGNFAGLDVNGNITDSGSKASDFATSSAVSGKMDVDGSNAGPGIYMNNTTKFSINQNTNSGTNGAAAFGQNTRALSIGSFAEGYGADGYIQSSGPGSHAEGYVSSTNGKIIASGSGSHAEGSGTCACATGAHSEGCRTIASGNYSHAEGYNTNASGNYSHAGYDTSYAYGDGSFVHARKGAARNASQVVFGFLDSTSHSPRYSSMTANSSSARQKNSIFSINHNTITHGSNQYGDPPHNNESESRY